MKIPTPLIVEDKETQKKPKHGHLLSEFYKIKKKLKQSVAGYIFNEAKVQYLRFTEMPIGKFHSY